MRFFSLNGKDSKQFFETVGVISEFDFRNLLATQCYIGVVGLQDAGNISVQN